MFSSLPLASSPHLAIVLCARIAHPSGEKQKEVLGRRYGNYSSAYSHPFLRDVIVQKEKDAEQGNGSKGEHIPWKETCGPYSGEGAKWPSEVRREERGSARDREGRRPLRASVSGWATDWRVSVTLWHGSVAPRQRAAKWQQERSGRRQQGVGAREDWRRDWNESGSGSERRWQGGQPMIGACRRERGIRDAARAADAVLCSRPSPGLLSPVR